RGPGEGPRLPREAADYPYRPGPDRPLARPRQLSRWPQGKPISPTDARRAWSGSSPGAFGHDVVRNRRENRAKKKGIDSQLVDGSTVALVVGGQLAPQPRPSIGPVPLHGPWGAPLHLGDFLDGHPGEHPQLHEFRCLRIGSPELGEGFVQVEQLL